MMLGPRLKLAWLAVAGVALAQDARLPLSLKRAVEIALAPEGNARIGIAEEAIKQAEGRIAEARAAFLPDLESSIQERNQTTNLRAFGLTESLPANIPFAFPNIVGPFNIFDARATAQQKVFDFSTIRRFQASRRSAAATRDDLASTRDQIADQVARAYLLCLRAGAALDTARANVDLSQSLLKLAQNQKNAGTGTGIEVTRAQVQLANDRQRQIAAESDSRRAALQLLKVMGLRMNVDPQFSDKLAYQAVDAAGVDDALKKARSERAELKAQHGREETARLTYGAVKAERLPSIAAFGDYGTIGAAPIGAQPTRTIGITLNVPIFDGGRRDARRAESLSQYRQEKLRTHDLEDQIELEVRLALESLRSAAGQVDAAREGLGLAENELAHARRRYEAGVANSIEVTDAQTRLIRARDNQIAALYAHSLARLDLATATGNIQEYVNQ